MAVPSYKAVLKHYTRCGPEVRGFFPHLPQLIVPTLPWEVGIAYQFIRVETGQNRAIYGGVVKLHRADASIAESMLNTLHITRTSFLQLFQTVFGQPLPAATVALLKAAEKVRDKTVHGKSVRESDARQAIVDVLDYATAVNDFVDAIAGFNPFGSMQGFKGAGQPLPKTTTKWLLKGLGISSTAPLIT
jgi:hypothetical protein